jgi:aromatic-L-amino-acid/L-tryptophan decarboxylase
MKEQGARAIGSAVEENVRQARALGDAIDADDRLQLLAPVQLNVVCFRYRVPEMSDGELDRFNDELVLRLQESGIALTSLTNVGSCRAIRVNITNHRTRDEDLTILLDALKRLAAEMLA